MSLVEELKRELSKREAEADVLRQAIAVLESDGTFTQPVPNRRDDFRGLGIVDAAKRFIERSGGPQTTKAIAEELLRRGLQTTSRNFVATVYSTLDNSKQLVRIGNGRSGRWAIGPAEEQQ